MLRNLANKIFGDITLVFNRSEEYARNRLHILWFSIFANVVVVLYGGYFFTGMLLKLGASDAYMGGITVVTCAGSIAAVFSPLLIERFRRRKALLLAIRCVYYLLLLGLITAMPYIGIGNDARLAVIMAVVALVNLLSSLMGSGMSVWHLQSMPESVRSTFFSNLNMIIGVLNMILLNLAGLFADFFKARGQEMLGIVLLRLVACLFAAFEIYNLSRIREYPYPKAERNIGLLDIFRNPLKDRRYRSVMAVIMIWMLAASIPGPFYQVYLIRDLKISYSFLSMVNLLNIPVLLLAMPIWGRLVARVGEVRIFPKLTLLIVLHFLSLSFVTKANYQWLYPASVFYYFLIAAGITQAASLMPYRFIPETNQSNFLSFYSAVTTLGALLGTLVGQWFVVATEGAKVGLPGIDLGNKQLLMAVAAFAVLAGTVATHFIVARLQKADAGTQALQTGIEL